MYLVGGAKNKATARTEADFKGPPQACALTSTYVRECALGAWCKQGSSKKE